VSKYFHFCFKIPACWHFWIFGFLTKNAGVLSLLYFTGFKVHSYASRHLKPINESSVEKLFQNGIVHLKQSCCPESKVANLQGAACS
jgi:hypothetical protein